MTKSVVDGLNPTEVAWDSEVKGFGVRCQRRDKVYVLKYRSKGRQRWFTIGKHGSPWTADAARNEAKRVLGLVAAGGDPATKKSVDRAAPTVGELAKLFLQEHAEAKSKPRTHVEYRRLVDRIVMQEIGSRRADDVTGEDIRKLHFRYRATPYQANRVLALLSKVFNWSGRRGEANPCSSTERYKEHKRRRYLSGSELARLGAALATAENSSLSSPFPIAAIRLLIFTGARLNEILTLEWEHVDLELACLNLKASKTGAKTIHLSTPAFRLLSALPRVKDNPFVIVGDRPGRHLVNLQKAWLRIRSVADLPDVRLHDLRHSFASIGAGASLGLPIIGALLGHTQPATTARYAHLAANPLKDAVNLIGFRLTEALNRNDGEKP